MARKRSPPSVSLAESGKLPPGRRDGLDPTQAQDDIHPEPRVIDSPNHTPYQRTRRVVGTHLDISIPSPPCPPLPLLRAPHQTYRQDPAIIPEPLETRNPRVAQPNAQSPVFKDDDRKILYTRKQKAAAEPTATSLARSARCCAHGYSTDKNCNAQTEESTMLAWDDVWENKTTEPWGREYEDEDDIFSTPSLYYQLLWNTWFFSGLRFVRLSEEDVRILDNGHGSRTQYGLIQSEQSANLQKGDGKQRVA
ncbi:hypothetical protein C8R45DRAFT_1173104 [Mycena sanguinolenta]|nr:hypothetical protein C8R45DRAFT_1173104 [Mycena sanguinolenta]